MASRAVSSVLRSELNVLSRVCRIRRPQLLARSLPAHFAAGSAARLHTVASSQLRALSLVRPNTLTQSPFLSQSRLFSSKEPFVLNLPTLGADSVTEGAVANWVKNVGDSVAVDDVVCIIETDKVSVDVRAPVAGTITEIIAAAGSTVQIGAPLVKITPGAAGAAAPAKPAAPAAPAAAAPAAAKPATPAPAAAAPKAATPAPAAPAAPAAAKPAAPPAAKPAAPGPAVAGSRSETRVPMSRMRLRIAERLKQSQNENACLTTFNEIDMTNAMEIRNKYKDVFAEKHGVKLGFMSFFVRAASAALKSQPDINAVIEGKDIVYRDYVDISVAVATPTGLVVPVLRNCENMSYAQIEGAIAALGQKARKGQIAIEDMVGGTFTISNGGVYGSMMGTPIINPPQSAILGMHGIFKRPVVINDKIEIRQMMYVALTYDHRLIDGQGAVTFLKKIKDGVEDPTKLLLDLI